MPCHCHLKSLTHLNKGPHIFILHWALQIRQLGLSTWLPPSSLCSGLSSGVLFAKEPFLATLLKNCSSGPSPTILTPFFALFSSTEHVFFYQTVSFTYLFHLSSVLCEDRVFLSVLFTVISSWDLGFVWPACLPVRLASPWPTSSWSQIFLQAAFHTLTC